MIRQYHIHFFVILLLFHIGNAVAKQDRNNLILNNDCSQTSVDYQNNPNLTQQEKIDLMDRALLRSLNKYEACQTTQKSTSSHAGGTETDGSADAGNDGFATKAGSGSSSASSTMSGTETPVSEPSSSVSNEKSNQSKQQGNTNLATPTGERHAGHQQQQPPINGSGRVPGDIPPVDNDSVLEAQIRQAAVSESDPVIKARLWNEYRKYKGLPVRKP